MRHAKSDWSHSGLRDHDRPLNTRGEKSARALGRWLAQTRGCMPDQVLCSSATRTGQTLLGLNLPSDVPTRFTRTLYHAGPVQMRAVLEDATGDCTLMIGHNPGICEMAHQLVATAPPHDRFDDYPTGATLVADFAADRWNDIGWHQGQPIHFVTPRDLP